MGGFSLIVTDGVPVAIDDVRFAELASSRIIYKIPALVFWAGATYLLCVVIASRTRIGRYIYAIGGGERVAAVSGVPVNRYKIYEFRHVRNACCFGGRTISGLASVSGTRWC